MKVKIVSDHAGNKIKEELAKKIAKEGYEVILRGATSDDDQSCSYSDVGIDFAREIINDKDRENTKYIAICGSGIGISIALNRFKQIRCARVTNVEEAKLAKQHNDANVLCFGGRLVTVDQAFEMFKEWEHAKFEGNRHIPRIIKLDEVGEER
ncbi:ribose 5-phosphate isomerase B [Metamycoplasma subdolum]|uniref:Ribose 5-phosphate isomerase B n=1 Tax=Metamycoplasma subdolum TaxID=92407 RepID=A0A3M0A550_9BACT|nr:RpiB/LacA/LacB family sugar-phosphate isomerase [Metamycoplasma subdolum]RMA77595.1 ribose 5-phosphate isomerase B [Metamycoplasma subdolum]WPB50389.1 RpiB/LacA/LacB family sugar-phosphate isomerase [Metamycoplasma subdolum]